ncbi:hypothetical protein ABW20_dc0104482 [Dactylellina cionopaga]|nr:hypothetical protein ABW20_dc0104482 [Dactylellina cionopaga]
MKFSSFVTVVALSLASVSYATPGPREGMRIVRRGPKAYGDGGGYGYGDATTTKKPKAQVVTTTTTTTTSKTTTTTTTTTTTGQCWQTITVPADTKENPETKTIYLTTKFNTSTMDCKGCKLKILTAQALVKAAPTTTTTIEFTTRTLHMCSKI